MAAETIRMVRNISAPPSPSFSGNVPDFGLTGHKRVQTNFEMAAKNESLTQI